jgi:peptide/nickel transport system substrate-binding protein
VTPRTLCPALLAAALAASSVAAPSAAAPFVATLALTMTGDAAAQSGPGHTRRNSIVIVTGQLATLPIPTLMEGAAASVANGEIADQLFLRLANLGPTLATAGDKDFVPMLARSWSRRDSLTLVFELDPRARWHDGAPVTARDVVFTYERSRDPRRAPRVSNLLRHITAVTAEGDRRVVFRFARRYAEQFYDATWHVQPLPAHLLDTVPADRLERSAFVTSPVGNGPYKWGRSVPGQFIELTANGAFFLGRPKIERVIVRLAADPDARLNLLLSGEADAADNIPPPLGNIARVAAAPGLRVIPVPSPTVGYLLFNQRNPADRSAPHPVLADIRVRRAITLALDRKLMNQKVLGPYGSVPYGPVAPYLWIRYGAPEPLPQNQAEARRLLAAAGWQDRDGDGIVEREGRPLALRLNFPATSGIRRQLALLAQEQLRGVGIRIDLQQLDVAVWQERRSSGNFDIDFSSASQDPSPSGLTQSWSCAGGSNVARYCNPAVDSLINQAILAPGRPTQLWHLALRRIEDDAPAAFVYGLAYATAVHQRFGDVAIRPESSWLALWQWSVKPAQGQGTP